MFNIAENTGILKYKLYDCGIPVEIMPPTTVKKYATGKGNANKEAMYEAFLEQHKYVLELKDIMGQDTLDSPVTDIIDAYYICKAGIERI